MIVGLSLAEMLSSHWRQIAADLPTVANEYDAIISRLLMANAGQAGPQLGDKLPPFILPDETGVLVRSADLLARGPLVVSLNRGHWCSFCRLELDALQVIHAEIRALGAEVVAIVPETQRFAIQLKSQCNLAFPVLSDIDNGYAMSLELVVWLGDSIKPLFAELGIDLGEYQGNESWLVPVPATYVLAPDGRIQARFADADYRHRMEPRDILDALRAATSG